MLLAVLLVAAWIMVAMSSSLLIGRVLRRAEERSDGWRSVADIPEYAWTDAA